MTQRARLAFIPVTAALLCAHSWGQTRLVGTDGRGLHLLNTDLAVLTAQEVRKDLPCTVTPSKPVLGFDLRFHSGFEVDVPLKELAGTEDKLTILFRITPKSTPNDAKGGDPIYFIQHIHVPSIEEDAAGSATLGGAFDLGEGSYHVDWLMHDRSERVCSFYWDSEAQLAPKDKQMSLEMAPGAISRYHEQQFSEDPPVARASDRPLNIKILVNFAPQNYDASTLQPKDTVALVSILRRISREPQFGRFSVVAFNIQEQRVLYRQSSAQRIDFPALGHALQTMKLGTIDLKRLAQKHGDTEFLTDLIKKEMSTDDHPDALVFAGPKLMLDAAVPQDTLTPIATDVDYPVFYMNYNLYPQSIPWKDSISRAVKVFRGTEYSINRPRDLWFSVSDMVSRIVKSSRVRATLPTADQRVGNR